MTRGKQLKNAKSSTEDSNTSFNEEDRRELHENNNMIKILIEEVKMVKEELESSNRKVKLLELENANLKKTVNLTLYKIDALEQYGRRENLRFHGIPENTTDSNDDGEEMVLSIAKALNIKLDTKDIQRAHRIGKKPDKVQSKPRPIIARFISFKKRNEVLYAKSKLKEIDCFSKVFITEDLTPLRSKLLNYVKKECDNEFVMCHTYNGKVKMKKSAKKAGLINDDERDQGTGPWLTISSPDDFFKVGVDIDFNKLNYKPLLYNSEIINISEPCPMSSVIS